ncbi:WD40/YVTN/BNR-like repeat-containing protein [Spirosoma pollinicola]|uniref:Glycosyl hydrolase n=1 Tax=Spirosoma pollinicola TaxID=2057025 RepID=A0A2K8Z0F8_9BACT|nr:sialidase family protein [Spirosoma pollinicola]AUD03373.1 glycosyl hydrolase [Spirosoma pollinicola]
MEIYSLAFLLLFQFPFSCNEALDLLASSPITDSRQKLNSHKSGLVNIVFKSTDGGQTWQDMSEGLPEGLKEDGFFATTNGLYLQAENGLYHSSPNSTAPYWEKDRFPDQLGRMYTNFQEKQVRIVFETVGGTAFIGSDNGLLKSTNGGETWKRVHTGGWVMKLVESNGVLMATSQKGILRSTDDGESWDCVISEGGVGIAVERINGGFAAITYNTQSETRRVRTSYDGGKSWQPIDADLPASLSIASIVEVGDYFFCGHPAGIFRSSDKGKTWKLLFPSIDNKVFNLSVSGNVIYAIPRAGGC